MNCSKLLVIETSERTGQVGLVDNGQLIFEQKLDAIKKRSSDLAEVMATLLNHAGWKPKDLTGVAVGQGPGSFTGLRVGIISAKVLAYTLQIPLFAVPTFETLAFQAPSDVTCISVISDALKKKVYSQTFIRHPQQVWVEQIPLQIQPFDQWKASVGPTTWVTGPGLALKDCDTQRLRMLDASLWSPNLKTITEQVIHFPKRYESDYWQLEPIYARGSYAEENSSPMP